MCGIAGLLSTGSDDADGISVTTAKHDPQPRASRARCGGVLVGRWSGAWTSAPLDS